MPGPKDIAQSVTLPPPTCRLPMVHPTAISSPGERYTCTWPSTLYNRKRDPSDWATCFHSFLVQFWGSYAHFWHLQRCTGVSMGTLKGFDRRHCYHDWEARVLKAGGRLKQRDFIYRGTIFYFMKQAWLGKEMGMLAGQSMTNVTWKSMLFTLPVSGFNIIDQVYILYMYGWQSIHFL